MIPGYANETSHRAAQWYKGANEVSTALRSIYLPFQGHGGPTTVARRISDASGAAGLCFEIQYTKSKV